MMDHILFAFGLTLIAGLATGIGSLLAFFTKTTNTKFLSLSLGFSAGVMIYVSMIDIFVKAKDALVHAAGTELGNWLTVAAFFAGMLLIALIDHWVPNQGNPHEHHKMEKENKTKLPVKDNGLLKMGLYTAIAIAIHNFPEGIATFTSALQDPALGVAIAAAIAIHNIPEGIAVSVPIYYATGDRKRRSSFRFFPACRSRSGLSSRFSF